MTQANGHAPPVQINPQQAAAYALQFIADVAHTRAQREQYDIAVSLLQAIIQGQVQLVSGGQQPHAEAPAVPVSEH
jgi:hypothetical protein